MNSYLNLKSLSKDYRPGITESCGGFMAEAAAVCLDSQNHKNNVILSVFGIFKNKYAIQFDPVTDSMKRSHNDLEVATEYGAYGISLLVIKKNTELTVIERSRKGTGFDFWLGTKDKPGAYLQNKANLEVSGIRQGSDDAVESRLKAKINQVKRSDGMLPAFIIIVEFGSPMAKVVEK